MPINLNCYRNADKSLARPGRKQTNISVRMEWISFGVLHFRKKKKTWWQLASRCCWNRARPWRASELVSFLVGLRTYQHRGMTTLLLIFYYFQKWSFVKQIIKIWMCRLSKHTDFLYLTLRPVCISIEITLPSLYFGVFIFNTDNNKSCLSILPFWCLLNRASLW